MPNTASASKRLRQTKVRQARNKTIKTAMRTQVKKVKALVTEGNIEDAEKEFILAAKKLDKAGAKGIIHRNAAGRTKSRLQHAIKSAKNS
ncbi:MAG: small subunit ribosomal protein S20 [Mariniblastus sp.]|jgi:small subunit ribosomal protein S20